jgi:hypothetical protein
MGGEPTMSAIAASGRTPIRSAAALLLLALSLGGCETTGGGPSVAEKAPVTRTQAAEECWMSTEKGASSKSLDKRADDVAKCIGERMNGAPAPKG